MKYIHHTVLLLLLGVNSSSSTRYMTYISQIAERGTPYALCQSICYFAVRMVHYPKSAVVTVRQNNIDLSYHIMTITLFSI